LAERGYSQLAVIPGQLQGSRGLQGWSLTAACLSCSAFKLVINFLKGHAHFFRLHMHILVIVLSLS